MSIDSKKGLKVTEHPDQNLIHRMLLSGWVPLKIESWLKERYPTDDSKWICERTLLDYRKNFLNLNEGLPVSVYENRLKQIDVAVDTLQELYSAIEQQKRRMGWNLAIEDKNKVSLPDTREEMDLLYRMITKAVELEMRLGIRKESPAQLEVKQFSLEVFLTKYRQERKENESTIIDVEPEQSDAE